MAHEIIQGVRVLDEDAQRIANAIICSIVSSSCSSQYLQCFAGCSTSIGAKRFAVDFFKARILLDIFILVAMH
jgi:hypothetical protein